MFNSSNLQEGGKWHPVVFYVIAIAVLAFDQLTKHYVRTYLAPGQSIPAEGFARITHVQNSGAVWGIFPDQSLVLKIMAIVGICLIFTYVYYINRRFPILNNMLGSVVLGLLLGGAFGNLIDRFSQGYVTDFIDIGPWPMFNISDSSVVVGTILFALILLISIRAENQAEAGTTQHKHHEYR